MRSSSGPGRRDGTVQPARQPCTTGTCIMAVHHTPPLWCPHLVHSECKLLVIICGDGRSRDIRTSRRRRRRRLGASRPRRHTREACQQQQGRGSWPKAASHADSQLGQCCRLHGQGVRRSGGQPQPLSGGGGHTPSTLGAPVRIEIHSNFAVQQCLAGRGWQRDAASKANLYQTTSSERATGALLWHTHNLPLIRRSHWQASGKRRRALGVARHAPGRAGGLAGSPSPSLLTV